VALRRWAWIWGPALAALVLVVLLLPPGEPTRHSLLGGFGQADAEIEWAGRQRTQSDRDVRAALDVQQRLLDDGRLADSAIALARGPRALRSADGQVAVIYEAPFPADSARLFLRAALSELALYPRQAAGGMPIVVAIVARRSRANEKSDQFRWWWTILGLGDAASSSGACVVYVNRIPDRTVNVGQLIAHDAAGQPVGRFLNSCALYARFGVPGPAVARWVGELSRYFWWRRRDPLALRLWEARRDIRREVVERRSDLLGNLEESGMWMEVACLRGTAPRCARAVGLEGGPLPIYFYRFNEPFTHGQLLGHLLAKGTAAQFAAFWRSPKPIGEALAGSYGLPAGELARAAYTHWYETTPGGPRADEPVVVVGLLWSVLALTLALVAGRRWKTEV
jgi:hypothetical protein